MNMRPRRLLLIGIGAVLIFTIARIPAGTIAYFIDGSAVTLNGYSGTIWNGQARDSAVGTLQFGPLDWRWNPAGLLRGRIEFDLETHGSTSKVDGIAGVSLLGTIHTRETTLVLPLQELGAVQFGTTGRITIDVESLALKGQWPDSAKGHVQVSNLTMNIPESMDFGDFAGDFEIDGDGDLVAQISDVDGPLAITATFTLDSVGNYLLDGNLQPRGRPGNRIQNLLQFMPRETDGSYILGFSGQL